jgi:ArsR family transcriptional regulator
MSNAFKALSNPNRLKIFMRLLNCCPPGTACDIEMAQKFCVGDLGDDLDIAPSTLSHHIKELSQAGLVQLERRGQNIDCSVVPERVVALRQFFTTD